MPPLRLLKYHLDHAILTDLPGEASGVVKSFKGSAVALATLSFGQGISTTAIQLVNGISTIANGGFLMKPYLTKAIIAPDGKVVKEYNPTVVRRVFSEDTMVMARSILRSVTERGGTGVKGQRISNRTLPLCQVR